ncbi:150_t:CDS:2 [Funneliformis caledonium]|uniref:150_t:CDS:1 n=1 Tax=Funneliformis caledonium TaxID=1117310 RepID=A0A9N8VKI9_9GLOM|nr:150_t:CDS:2 [Funneliformis caledonium]
MGQCFLLRRIFDLLNYKSKTTDLHKQFFEVDCDQELFNDLGIHENDINVEKSILRGFPLEGSPEATTKLSSLPTECLTQIFQNVGTSGLFSCLLVCRAWCRKVVPILWSKPFDKLPKDCKYKLIRTYITSLSTEEKSFLNLQLKQYGFRIPNATISLFNYPIYLKELSYVELYQAVDSGIKYYRKSFIGRNTYKLTFLITKSLCKTFLTKNINDSSYHLQSFKIDKYYRQNDDIFPEIDLFSKAQRSLQEFNLSGARIGANFIIPNLFSFHCNSLISVQFKNVNFHKVNLHLIASCKKLEHLTIYHCTGITKSSLPSANNLLNGNSTYFYDYNGMRLKSLNIGCSPKCSQIPKIILESPLTETCQELCLDLITPEITNVTRRNCQNVTTLILRDHFIINDVTKESSLIYNLFHGLLLERLIIIISPRNSDYDELNVRAIDLPSCCWYLELRCGFAERQFYDLLLSKDCVAPISVLILEYLKLNIVHLMTVRDFAMMKGTLKYFEICGRKDFDKDELKVIKDLQNVYNVNVNFHEN